MDGNDVGHFEKDIILAKMEIFDLKYWPKFQINC